MQATAEGRTSPQGGAWQSYLGAGCGPGRLSWLEFKLASPGSSLGARCALWAIRRLRPRASRSIPGLPGISEERLRRALRLLMVPATEVPSTSSAVGPGIRGGHCGRRSCEWASIGLTPGHWARRPTSDPEFR